MTEKGTSVTQGILPLYFVKINGRFTRVLQKYVCLFVLLSSYMEKHEVQLFGRGHIGGIDIKVHVA